MTGSRDVMSKTILLEVPPDGHTHGRTGRRRRSSRVQEPPQSPLAVAIGCADMKVLFENVYDAALITDLTGLIVDANPRASHAFGYTHDEFCRLGLANVILGFDASVMQMVCDNLTEDRFTLIQASCMRKDGTDFPTEISTSRMHLPGYDLLCFFIRDVTARREAEEQIRRARDELAVQVQQRTRLNEELNAEIAVRTEVEGKLREAITRLQAHDRAKSEFVSNVSHELKTPLASINYIAGNLMKGIAGPQGPQALEYLGMIRADCQRLARTVEDILDMSRIEASTLKIRHVRIHFPRFVRQTVESLRVQIEEAGLHQALAVGDANVFIDGDPQKIERVIFNVIRNAIKFNVPDGSIDVRLGPDPASGNNLLLEVIDSGIGIAPEHLKRITERFFRVGDHISGAGLGLAICKDLMEHHGGTIEFQSPPPGRPRGTWVGLRFPVASAPFGWLLSDDASVGASSADLLRKRGYESLALALDEPLDRATERRKPDFVVVAWTTPSLAIAGLLAGLRNSDLLKTTPLLVMTAGEDTPVKQEILRGLGAPRIQAPWQEEDLLRGLEQVVSGKRATTL